MKCTIPEISWHNREPVLSIDFQYSSGAIQRMATGGTDAHVLVWYVTVANNGLVELEFASDLRRHNKAVNIIRFSPSGSFLASGDDEAVIWLWKKVDKDPTDIFNEDDDKDNKEHWTAIKTLRGHIEDVYDLCWSADCNFLISGSVDNSAIIWDVNKGRNIRILSDHKGFVQGVAWDPLNQYVATLCSDRACRIYNINNRRLLYKIVKAVIPTGDIGTNSEVTQKPVRLFHDDTLKSFCRRLTFSPDGEFLIAPSGCLEMENGKNLNSTYIFSRHTLNKPALYLPTKEKYTVAVRCCPILFQLRSGKQNGVINKTDAKPWEINPSVFKLPYRIIFAVATQDSVLFYDTQQLMPFAQVSKIHYTRISDITWSKDGNILAVSSTDGYCSFVTFEENELGVPYKKNIVEENQCYSIRADEPVPRSPSPDKSVILKQPSSPPELNTIETLELNPSMNAKQPSTPKESTLIPLSSPLSEQSKKKRVQLVTLFSPKLKKTVHVKEASNDVSQFPTAQQKNFEPLKSKAKLEYPEDSVMEVDDISCAKPTVGPNDATLAADLDDMKLVLDLSNEETTQGDCPMSSLNKPDNESDSVVSSTLTHKNLELCKNDNAISLSCTESQQLTINASPNVAKIESKMAAIQVEHSELSSVNAITVSPSNNGSSPVSRAPRRIQPIMLSSKK